MAGCQKRISIKLAGYLLTDDSQKIKSNTPDEIHKCEDLLKLTDVTFVAAVESSVDLGVEEHSQRERVRQITDVVLRPARQTTVQTAVLLYRNVQCLHADDVTCSQWLKCIMSGAFGFGPLLSCRVLC